MPSVWQQHYDPAGNVFLSTLIALVPLVALLSSIALLRIRIHFAALVGLALALVIAIIIYKMPADYACASALYGAVYGVFPIGWIILNLIFLHQLTVKTGAFETLRASLGRLAPDPRIQVILIAFSFGAFFEGAAGFGTPVAITSAILMQLGFGALQASGLSLIANTAPVAFGALGTPIIALGAVTGIDPLRLSAMVGHQLPIFSFIIPFWIVWAMVGFRKMIEIWPAALTAGASFAIPQYFVSTQHGPWLVDIIAAASSIVAVLLLLRIWRPPGIHLDTLGPPSVHLWRAYVPWLLLTVFVFVWGLPQVREALNRGSKFEWAVPHLHNLIVRGREVVSSNTLPEKAIFKFEWLSATGTGILVAACLSGWFLGCNVRQMFRIYLDTIIRLRFSFITIAAMLALGFVTRYSGTDATLGLALARTGWLYPFFGTILGWLGVVLTGSDTASNVLFGNLQTITAAHVGVNPALMAAANSSGGVMGKMLDAQSIVVASTATNDYGNEGRILRFVFWHSLALATLVGLLVLLEARFLNF